jgi:hypothetical protein
MKFADFFGQDSATAATENFDMAAAIFIQKVFHVLEKLNVTALVRSDCNSLYIFFNGTFHDLSNRAVMAEMDDLRPFALQYPPHYIDRGIVPVK